jgi:uncharacterized protein
LREILTVTPSLSPKGTTAVWDDDHLIFADICSPDTMANLRGNPAIEINVVDVFSRKGFRFKEFAEVISEGARFDQALDFYRRRGGRRRINAAVLARIKRVRPLVSPAYELGDSESEIIARMRKYFDDLLARRATSRTPK